MVNIGLLGAGRIGMIHAASVGGVEDAQVAAVFDPDESAARTACDLTGAPSATVPEIMADPDVPAIIVATPTDLHADLVEQASMAGKVVFCEKPIDLDAGRVRACLKTVERMQTRLMIGFNRRFDPSFARVKAEIESGSVGEVEMIQITSRDPSPPPIDYLRRSGGIFRDMMIHDFDMVRFLFGEEITEVSATASVLIDPAIGDAGDYDTASATLRTASGRIAVITNSRRTAYGYDQRIEAHGSNGMVQADNHRTTSVSVSSTGGQIAALLKPFFLERYAQAYRREIETFCALAAGNDVPYPDGQDGLKALELADCALLSVKEERTVRCWNPD